MIKVLTYVDRITNGRVRTNPLEHFLESLVENGHEIITMSSVMDNDGWITFIIVIKVKEHKTEKNHE